MDFNTEPSWNFETIWSLKLNPLAFRIYQEEEHEIQKKYVNNKTIDFNLPVTVTNLYNLVRSKYFIRT